jgi:hypothetical protein
MTVRLGFAVASCIEPDILLVDEVLAVGDAAFRQKCMDRIQAMLDSGTSIIFVSHNLWMVQAVCKTALYLDHGQVIQHGETTEVLGAYDQSINEERTQKLRITQPEVIEDASAIDITRIEVLNKEGIETPELRNDEPVEIRVHYMAYNDIESVNSVVRILRSDGLTCCMIRSNLDGIPIHLKRGEGYISITLDPIQLYGGSYHVQSIFRDANDASSLASKTSGWFYVKGSVLSHQTMNGVFEPHRQWHHQVALQQKPDSVDGGHMTLSNRAENGNRVAYVTLDTGK